MSVNNQITYLIIFNVCLFIYGVILFNARHPKSKTVNDKHKCPPHVYVYVMKEDLNGDELICIACEFKPGEFQ